MRDSSVSGPLLWPADDPWPWCTGSSAHDGPNAYQPLLQVFARDAPTMFFPDGCDLLQLLWCPNEGCSPAGRALAGCPRPLARWRASADVTDILVDPPMPDVVDDEWFPRHPCVVSPEPVTEGGGSRWNRFDGQRPWREDDGHYLVLKGGLLAFACTHCPGAPMEYLAT